MGAPDDPDAGDRRAGAGEPASDASPGAPPPSPLERRHRDGAPRYEVRGELGRGGMGLVLEVFDADLRRTIAMKVLRGGAPGSGDGSESLVRFLDEAQITAQLDHPGVVPVHELGVDAQGRTYFTMGRVRGRSLKEILQDLHKGGGEWTLARAVGVIHRVCETMAFAHAKGVLHRDLKPTNVMVGRFGAVYVMDWGLACAKGREHEAHDLRLRAQGDVSISALATDRTAEEDGVESPLITLDGAVIGTPAYMSPEQARGEIERLGPASDVYSVGAMLYQVLTGRAPYVAPGMRVSAHTLLALVIQGPPERVETLARVPQELVAICEKAMAREPADRYPDMHALAEDLRAFLEGRVVRAFETGALAEARKWVRRNRGLAAALALLGFGAFASLIGWITLQGRHARERALAADVYRLPYFLEQADELWPATEARAPEMRAWIASVAELVARRDDHARRLARMAADDPARAPAAALCSQLGRLASGDPATSALAGMRARLAFAETLRARSIDAAADAWARARAEVAADPAFDGLDLAPQLGLLPLGRDPVSGLQEFAHLASGAPAVRGADGTLAIAEETGVVLVLIPGGAFRMGAERPWPGASGPNLDPHAHPYEGPAHDVRLDPYLLAKHEMTQAQWRRATGATPSLYNPDSRMRDRLTPGREWLHPVESVSWEECDRTLARLGLLLPTEAQWERAARGGEGTVYCGGDARDALVGAANLADRAARRQGAQWSEIDQWPELDDGFASHAPVDALRPNRYGLHHVHGNVFEWCRDGFVQYGDGVSRTAPGDGLRVPEKEDYRDDFKIARGGSHRHGALEARLSYRYFQTPRMIDYFFGVRPARAVEGL